MSGKNVLVFSPTSSGKTFVGEMAAVQVAMQNRRGVYLVPQKALAEEKYNEFHSKYRAFGVHVDISTRDRKEFDEMLTLYYEAMGWDPKEGVPTRGKLAELNLHWLDEFNK